MPEKITPTPKLVKTPDYYRDRLINTLTQVGETNYRAGVAFPDADPIAEGVKAEPRYKDEMQKVLNEERRAKMLKAKADLTKWGEMCGVFSDRLVSGVTNRAGDVDRFWKGWAQILERHKTMMAGEPNATFADRKNKMLKNVEELKKNKGAWLGKVA
jgi:hypothetical protein